MSYEGRGNTGPVESIRVWDGTKWVDRAVETFAASLAGTTGAQGATGSAGTQGATGPAGVQGATGPFSALRLQQHDNTYSPAGLWQLDGDLKDSSGQNYTLIATGGENYTDLGGVKGFFFTGRNSIDARRHYPLLSATGAMSVMALVKNSSRNISNQDYYIAIHAITGEAPPSNYLYQCMVIGTGAPQYFAEFGAGANVTVTPTGFAAPYDTVYHYGVTRGPQPSGYITFYINGVPIGTGGATFPDGGESGTFKIGSNIGVNNPTGVAIASVKFLHNRELTPSEMYGEYSKTFGFVPVGVTGPQGATGTQGATGPFGGPTGPQGATGPQGETGPQGATGVGAQGSPGVAGATGPTGPIRRFTYPSPSFPVSANYFASTFERVLYVPSSPFSIFAPTNPLRADQWAVKNVSNIGTAGVVINGGGNNVENPQVGYTQTNQFTLISDGVAITWEFDGNTSWIVV
jgi:hypothetical protein